MLWEESWKPIFPKCKGMKSKPAAKGYRDVPAFSTGRCSAAFSGFSLSLCWDRVGDLGSVLVPIIPLMGSLNFTLYDCHYIDLNRKYILAVNNAVPASEIKSHIILSEHYECVLLFLTAAIRDWNGGAQVGKAGMENKWKKKITLS